MAAAIYPVASAFVPTPPFGERITVDKWFSPFSEPVRQKIGLATREQRADWLVQATFGEPVFESKWHQPWSEPVRFRRLTTAQLAPEYVSTFKVEIITVDKWFIGLSEPQ